MSAIETKTKTPPYWFPGKELELQIGSVNYGRYNKNGYWLSYFRIKSQSEMDFSVLKCRLMPENFRIVEQNSGKVVYGCGAE